ncbi:phosphotransferase [Cereibacter azotoformans]|uniref:phosphotransferase n=1 Tax=Cereibacter azotoformans TaxID=43057 RepID=UPI001EEAAADF|nr:phosphotransferase [Cereibacter azotoformans]ULB09234.1 phosphotransferase [Cereibacter azotoformans]
MPHSALPIGTLLAAPRPAFTATEAEGLARAHFGQDGRALPLTSERDQNFRLVTGHGEFVLKIANAAEPRGVTEFQTLALLHLEDRAPSLPVPRVGRTLEGAPWAELPSGNLLRLLTWVGGEPLWRARGGAAQRRAIGRCLGGITAALADFAHPAADYELLWDIRHAARLRPLLPAIPDARTAVLAGQVIDRFDAEAAPRLADLPWQVVHNDMNSHNIMVDPADPSRVTGVIDFGDMVRTARACDLAIAGSYQLEPGDPAGSLADLVAGYHEANPLQPSEIEILPELVAARMVATIAIASSRAAQQPENAPYILRNLPAAAAGLEALTALAPGAAAASLARAVGEA